MSSRTSTLRTAAAISISAAAVVAFAACGGGSSQKSASAPTASAVSSAGAATAAATAPAVSATLTLTSDGFAANGAIPTKYSCIGEGKSPALAWSGAPAGTKAFALIVHDPDAPLTGGFTHWILIDLPPSATSLPAFVPPGETVAGGRQLAEYTAMCAPPGASAHHYHFRLYALDAQLGGAAGASKDSVEAAMRGHILAQTDLVGLFGR